MRGELKLARGLLDGFARRTGLTGEAPPVRYLWTDAFALCTCLGLGEEDGGPDWMDRARSLAAGVHGVLGRHRPDDARSGWISGLSETDGARHPTIGGLRIGKPLPERAPDQRFDRELEWERDGQYYHYLTRWIHALSRLAIATGDSASVRHAAELAATAHRGFGHRTPDGELRLYWKMSIDLERPLVPSMGQHDVLDGLVAFAHADAALRQVPEGLEEAGAPRLDRQIRELAGACRGRSWATDDPLGIGALLADALLLARLLASDPAPGDADPALMRGILEDAVRDAGRSVRAVAASPLFDLPADRRLGFRELGLSLGLAAADALRSAVLEAGIDGGVAAAALDAVEEEAELRSSIHAFWSEPEARASAPWLTHQDINDVMLAASLAPWGYLGIESPTARHEAAGE